MEFVLITPFVFLLHVQINFEMKFERNSECNDSFFCTKSSLNCVFEIVMFKTKCQSISEL